MVEDRCVEAVLVQPGFDQMICSFHAFSWIKILWNVLVLIMKMYDSVVKKRLHSLGSV